jgi:ATP-dependent Lon protease
VVLEGLGRARVTVLEAQDGAPHAGIELFVDRERDDREEAGAAGELAVTVVERYTAYARLHERIPEDLPAVLSAEGDRQRLAHLVAGHLLLPPGEKQRILEAASVHGQLARLADTIQRELELLRIEAKLDRRLQGDPSEVDPAPDFGPPFRTVHRERGEGGPREEWEEVREEVEGADLPEEARERAERELGRLRRLNPVAPEAAVIRSYLDWLVSLPWRVRSRDNLDVGHAEGVLDARHFGLPEVKERVLDHVAVLSLVHEIRGPILCLVGPPGVGKTSLGRSVAEALDRAFVRVSLGGVRDEAEIRGHRRTYVGALPGRVIQGMRRSGTRNPVFLLDEVDKLARDFHGDPGAALLEVLDPEQNRSFTDHYLELDFDLSDVLFIATANTLAGIPEPLRDRMEIIRLPGYLDTEKREIALRFLWPRQARRHGLEAAAVAPAREAVDAVIASWTREAGVRELDQRLSRIARKLARELADGSPPRDTVAPEDLKELLGPPPYPPPQRDATDRRVGIANGLAWTAAGGEVLDVEVAVLPGSGNLRLTGTLGEVMKESAHAAMTYARSRWEPLGLTPDFHETVDIHIHIPEGATPKDGPSAGITMAVALISALTGTPSRAEVALTGEITLRGRVLGVGGVKEKAVAALRGGIRTVILPSGNVHDLELLPEEVREGLNFVLVDDMDRVMAEALVGAPFPAGAPREPTELTPVRRSHG